MYATVEEVRGSIKTEVLSSLIGNELIEDQDLLEESMEKIIQEAIEDADGEIDGYLNKRYPVPLLKVPKVINKFSKDIALYNIFSRKGIEEGTGEENYLTRYKNAIRFLENVAKGLIEIGGAPDQDEQTALKRGDFQIQSSPRLFSRKTLRGM